MKIILLLLTLFFIKTSLGQNNCFENCLENFETSELEYPEKSETIIQNLIGCELPYFEANSIDNRFFSLKELSEKVIVINFYFAACKPCVAEIPALNKLVVEYEGKDVVFIAFSRDQISETQKFVNEKGFKYNVFADVLGFESKFCLIGGWPTNMVVDKNGVLRQVFNGGYTDERAKIEAYNKMKPTIDKCLSE